VGDYFAERFQAACGGPYAVFTLLSADRRSAIRRARLPAMTPKPRVCRAERQASRNSVAPDTRAAASLTAVERARADELLEKEKRGELRSFVSYVDETWFYIVYVLIVGIYTMLGGFRAAALTDAIQGTLIVVFSVLLIPVGLSHIGGLAGLHERVPAHMFHLFGSATLSDYAWYTIVGMVLANLVSIVAVASGMQTAGSATNEFAARIGMIGGMFLKRLLMLCWAFAGLLAIAIYANRLHDPDLSWGVMT
jgi:SSS family solute:Na+ symporter